MSVRFLHRRPRRRPALKLRVEPLEERCLLSGDIVIEWTHLLLNAANAHGDGNQITARTLAIMEAAVYDSVNAIDHAYTVYRVNVTAPPGTSAQAAAAWAAHDVAATLYPNSPVDFEGALRADLQAIPDSPTKEDGKALGQAVAAAMLQLRANDGSARPKDFQYTPGTDPGDWQPTPRPNPNPPPPELPGLPAATPWWGGVKPFALASGDQFRPGPPPALTDAEYTEAFQEIKALGGDGKTTPSTRTPEQTQIALFWAGTGVSNGGVAIWNQIAETVATAQATTLAQNARLFALLNVTVADSYIAGFDAKYTYNFWRPVTAIRGADTDGNPDTSPDPTWTPLLTTPAHPSYVSLHACQSEAAAQALASFFGTDHVSFSVTWPGLEQRSFHKFTEAAHEAGLSRIYGGIHWSFDVAAGWHVGRNVGQYVAANDFLPVTTPAGGTLGQAGGHGKGSDATGEASRIARGEPQEVGPQTGKPQQEAGKGVQAEFARKGGNDGQDLAGVWHSAGSARLQGLPLRADTTPREPVTGSGTVPPGGWNEPASSSPPPVPPSGITTVTRSAGSLHAAAESLFADLASGLPADGLSTALVSRGLSVRSSGRG